MYKKLNQFLNELREKELSQRTLTRYETDIKQFLDWSQIDLAGKILHLNKEKLIDYKKYLQDNFKTNTVNIKIVGLNKFLVYIGMESLKLKQQKQQRKTTLDNVLSTTDYERLLRQALKLNKIKIYMLMQVLAQTGIRISELQFITVEAIKNGFVTVKNKGKERKIIITKHLSKELKGYCKENMIDKGIIFKGRLGRVMDTAHIHRELKYISGQARVKKDKAHAHSFRHLFAKEFLNNHNDITLLADLLGHSSLETTRVYTKRSTSEQKKILENLNLNQFNRTPKKDSKKSNKNK